MKVAVTGVLVLLVTGCSGSTAAVHSASPAASPGIASAPRLASPAPEDLPLTTASVTCRLPVLVVPQEGSYQGGFITFPGGTFAADPGGLITSDVSSDLLRTTQAPVLTGRSWPSTGLPFYDAAEHRWLPVGPGATSPDGSRYAYADSSSTPSTPTQIHVVDVASGADRRYAFTSPVPDAIGMEVADFDGANVYLTYGKAQDPSFYGVLRLDLATGVATSLALIPYVEALRGGIVWAGLNDPRDPNPPGGGQSFDTLISVDLTTGVHTVWDYEPGRLVNLSSVDASGRPTIVTLDRPDYVSGKVARLIGPGRADFVTDDLDHWHVQPDGDRLWFGNDLGIYLYTPAAGLQKVYSFAPNPGFESIFPAGFCG